MLGGHLSTELCLKHPLPVVPSRRFGLAAELILGDRLTSRYSSELRSKQAVDASVEQQMQQRAETLGAVRRLCSPDELLAYDLLRPTGIAWAAYESQQAEKRRFTTEVAAVSGLVGAHRMADREHGADDRPYDFMYLTQRAGLLPGQHVKHYLVQGGVERRRNGFLEQLEFLAKEAGSFNAHQERFRLPSDLATVEALVSEALERQGRDAAGLAARVSGLPVYEGATARGVLASSLQRRRSVTSRSSRSPRWNWMGPLTTAATPAL